MQSAKESLIQIVDAATAEAVRRGGDWVVCRAGCCECCIGVFPIGQSDALRLREGLRQLEESDPVRAARVSFRAQAAIDRYRSGSHESFPGDAATGILGDDPESEERFENFADDDACPALDPATGTCDLYAWRPMTCRTFGAALRLNSDSVDICELCYRGATDEEIVACEVELETADLEADLEREAEMMTQLSGQTIVAFALRQKQHYMPQSSSRKTNSRKPEIMSPAGYWPQLRAAVEAGADAVYFGLKHFSARAKVGFSLDELPEVMTTLHGRGVRGYITFNTLVFEHELASAAETIATLAKSGVDAIIVQDYGIVGLSRQIAPELELHASTQMSITDVAGVKLAQSFGLQRVTLARELSLDEIRTIYDQTGCDLEIFVHGALCVAYSGQCFSSEAWGGRSANRGQCAQACRLPYELIVDGALEPLADARYLLSPGDLFALEQVPQVIESGVAALKIEGRYKDEEYVALTTRAYRKAVDEAWAGRPTTISREEKLQLEQVYSRGLGPYFLTGTNHQAVVNGRAPRHRGLQMGRVAAVQPDSVAIEVSGIAPLKAGDGVVFDAADWRSPGEQEEGGRIYQINPRRDGRIELRFGNGEVNFARIRVGDLLWRTHDPDLARLSRPYTQATAPVARQRLAVRVVAREGEPLSTEWHLSKRPEIVAHVNSPSPLGKAQNRGISKEYLEEQFGRLGNTAYVLDEIELDTGGLPFAPASLLNQMRRDAVEMLQRLQTEQPERMVRDPHDVLAAQSKKTAHGRAETEECAIHLLVRTPEQLDAAIDMRPDSITLDYLDLYGLRPSIERLKQSGIPARVASPRILKPGESRILNFLVSLDCAILVRSAGMLHALRELPHSQLIGDFSLNAANLLTARTYLDLGLERLTPTHDLNADQVAALAQNLEADRIEAVAYHHLPVFHTEHCVFCRFLSSGTSYRDCGRPCEKHVVALRDQNGRAHPVMADVGCRNTVFGAEAQQASQHLASWRRAGIRHFRLEFAHESGAQVEGVTRAFASALDGRLSGVQLAAEWKRVAPEGITEGSLFVPSGYLTLPILQ